MSDSAATSEMDALLGKYASQADRLVDALNQRMKLRSAANITEDELGYWIVESERCAQALRDVRLLRRLGAHV